MMKYLKIFVFIFATCALPACHSEEASQTLMLSLMPQGQQFDVYGVQVEDQPYKKGKGSSGIYQVQLINAEGNVFNNFRFGKQYFSSSSDQKLLITLPLPLSAKLSSVQIYRLNGRSGHFQVDTSDTLLAWSVPDSLHKN